MRAWLALRLAYRLALTGPRHEQRQHVVHSPEHSEHSSFLIATTIIERMGCIVDLVHLVALVYLVALVCVVSLVQ